MQHIPFKTQVYTYTDMSEEFRKWIALYFIEKGNWKVTDKAIEEFGTDVTPRQTMEFAEVCSDREREERTDYRVGLTEKEKKRITHMKIAGMVDEGKAEELYDNNYITNYADWKNKTNRIAVVRNLMRIIDKDPRDLTQNDFKKNKLEGLSVYYYKSSPYKAVKEAFPEKNIQPWEMKITPNKFFDEKKNRIAAVRWLVIEKLKKDPRDLTADDFYDNRLTGLFEFYDSSQYKAVIEAFPEMDIKPWEMARIPAKFYEEEGNRVAAVKRFVEKIKKDPRDLTADDFNSNKLGGLFVGYYDNSPYKAVKEAFPEKNIQPWEMKITPNKFFDVKENRIAAVKWLVKEKLKKNPRDLTKEDFCSNRLSGLLQNHYKGSPYEAVKEAGLVTEVDEKYMRQKGHCRHSEVLSSKEVLEAAKKIERNVAKKQEIMGKGRDPKKRLY